MTAATKNLFPKLVQRHSGANGDRPEWLTGLQQNGATEFGRQGLPTTRHEDWKYMDVTPLGDIDFVPPEPLASTDEWTAAVDRRVPDGDAGIRAVFIDGQWASSLSHTEDVPDGLRVMSLAAAAADPDLAELVQAHLGRCADCDTLPFTALNTACFDDGLFIHIPDGHTLDVPVHVVLLGTGQQPDVANHLRTLIVLGRGAKAEVVCHCVSGRDARGLTNSVTEIQLGDGADLDLTTVQQEAPENWHIADITANIGRDAQLSTVTISLEGGRIRNTLTANLNGEGGHCSLNGLYFGDGKRLVDNHTVIHHIEPHCTSHELYHGILKDRSVGVFNGKIFVRPEAQKTDAVQTNRALLLSEDAKVNTKPQLEIFADDVRCTHGATVGPLDEEAIFYLRSRGLADGPARALLTHAFAGEVLALVRNTCTRKMLESMIQDKLV